MSNASRVPGATLSAVVVSEEYDAFDQLPVDVRDALRNAHFKYSAQDCLGALKAGVPSQALLSIIAAKDAALST